MTLTQEAVVLMAQFLTPVLPQFNFVFDGKLMLESPEEGPRHTHTETQ